MVCWQNVNLNVFHVSFSRTKRKFERFNSLYLHDSNICCIFVALMKHNVVDGEKESSRF